MAVYDMARYRRYKIFEIKQNVNMTWHDKHVNVWLVRGIKYFKLNKIII